MSGKAKMMKKRFSGKSLFFCLFTLLVLLNACGPVIIARTGNIDNIAWDEENPGTLLLLYSYNKGDLNTPNQVTEFFKLTFNQTQVTSLEKIGLASTIPTKDFLPYFEINASKLFLWENLDKLIPFNREKHLSTDKLIYPTAINTASFKYSLILVSMSVKINENSDYPLRVVDISNFTVRDIQMPKNISDSPPQIRWTGFENDVLLEYQKDLTVYHALGNIDLDKSELTNFKIFKSYPAKELGGLSSVREDQDHVKVLGFENKNTVYYLENPAFSKQAAFIKLDVPSGETTQLASFDIENSYYPFFSYSDTRRYHDQISIAQRKVAYLANRGIMISNLDGTGQRKLLDIINDLPKGGPLYGPQ